MSSDLVRERPGGFDIRPAAQPAADRLHGLGSEPPVGVYRSSGLSNSYLVVTPGGRVVINTGMGFEAPVHKRNYDAIDDRPVRYILLTQGHVDHVGGADVLAGGETEIVAQARNLECQADDARIHRFRVRRSAVFWAEAVQKADDYIRAAPDDAPAPAQSVPTPTITFDDAWAFELGDVRFELLATPGGETVDSMVVWLPEHRIAFVGNLFSALFGHFPNLMTLRGDRLRFVPPFLESLDRVRSLDPEVLLTGHFGPIEGRQTIRAELDRIEGAVRHVHDATVEGMNRGADVHTLMREIRVPDELALGEGYGKVAWGVRAIWEGYAGWFHFGSTTELYGVPAAAVHPDVVELAGGPEPVVARAREHLEAGRPLEAVHLIEMVLAVDRGHRGAREVERAAHQTLLTRSEGENFWEVGWLRHRISRAQRSLDHLDADADADAAPRPETGRADG